LLDLPMENAALALQAYLLMGLPWDAAQVRQALLATRITGRLDRAAELAGQALSCCWMWAQPACGGVPGPAPGGPAAEGRRLAVFGLLADKDLDGVIAPLQGWSTLGGGAAGYPAQPPGCGTGHGLDEPRRRGEVLCQRRRRP
jgi:dihydrofolate synthase/folylpolyglutamate synthase